ncbi:MAG: glutathione S-transferase family protein [Erythrobacter sp.]
MTQLVPALYFAPSTCARVTLTALEEIGQPFETRLIAFMAGEHRQPDFLTVNPAGKVPALDTGRGVVTQNGSILLYLARAHPAAGLLPLIGDPLLDAPVISALFRFSSDLHPLVTRFVLPGVMLSSSANALLVREKAEEVLLQQLHPFDAQLEGQPWLLGQQWSILDAYLAWIWFRITGAGFESTTFPHIASHYDRAMDRPSAKATLDREAKSQEELEQRGLAFAPSKVA